MLNLTTDNCDRATFQQARGPEGSHTVEGLAGGGARPPEGCTKTLIDQKLTTRETCRAKPTVRSPVDIGESARVLCGLWDSENIDEASGAEWPYGYLVPPFIHPCSVTKLGWKFKE